MSHLRLTFPITRLAIWSEEPLPGLCPESPRPGVDLATGAPDLAAVDAMTRRRLSPLARGMIHAALRVVPEPGDMRTVFASQHGDLERTWALMRNLAEEGELSPAHFSVSVHNAVAGLWSLLRRNRGPASAVAAGPETLPLGLLEAWTAWRREPEHPVLFVYGEHRVPEVFRPFTGNLPFLSCACLIGEPAALRLDLEWDPADRRPGSGEAAASALLPLLAGSRAEATWRGPQGAWVGHVE